MAVAETEPVFFASSEEFRAWLLANHAEQDAIWLGYYKKGAPNRGISYKEAVDQALCFGWIDGLAKSIDQHTYRQRFTPRRAKSIWSAVNTKRVTELTKLGLMHESGLREFERRDPARANLYSFENETQALAPEDEARFRANEAAWAFFETQPPSYRKPALWWVATAKRPETRQRRLDALIADSAQNRRLRHLSPGGKRKP